MKEMSPPERERYIEIRRAASLKRWGSKTPEQRSEEARARWAKINPKRRSELATAAWARRSTEDRSRHCEATKLALAKDETKTKQCAASQRMWDARAVDERARITAPMQAAWVAMPFERRSEIAKAAKFEPGVRSSIGRARWAGTTHESRSELAKARWASRSKERRREILEPAFSVAGLTRPTSIERTTMVILDTLGVEYKPQHLIGRYVVDFYVPSRNLVIECDGSYWHSLPGASEKDAQRDAWMIDKGYTVLRLPEREIQAGAASGVIAAALGA